MAPLLILVALARAGGGTPVEVGPIDAACKATEVAGRAAKATVRIFAEVSGAVLPKPREGQWRELETEAELEALSKSGRPPNTEAIVRTTPRGTLVSMYFQDATSSWAHVVDYCYGPTGALARVRGTFNSFTAAGSSAGIRRRRTIYYDPDGAILRTRTGVFDLDTDQPRPDARFVDQEDPVYPALRAVPFSADLLPPVAAADLDPNGVVATVRDRLPALRACYENALRRTPGIAGKIVARWSIDGAGKVTAFAWESDQMHSPAFCACARRVIEKWRFPPAREAPVSVSFPFVFESKGADVTIAPTVSSLVPGRP